MESKIVDEIVKEYGSSENIVFVKKGNIFTELSEGTIKEYTLDIINELIDELKHNGDFKKNVRVLEQLIELKKAYWPATQKQITSNIDVFDEQLKMWYQANEEFKKMETERVDNLKRENQIEDEIEAIS